MKHKLGHYDIVAELGRGGMGVVYKAYETSLNRFVAIKVLAEALSHDESLVERFMREARSMAALNDPHIIQIYYIGQDQGQPFFVMEFVEGESLSSKLHRQGHLDPGEALQIVVQTARGLATAHDRGVIHRDIKPGNLMISERGTVKIADFGIALATQDFSKKLTSTGEFVGTPGYLSPEVCLGKPVDQRSDIFALGIVLFEMLTGRTPFNDESPLGLMLEVVKSELPDIRQLNDKVDEALAALLAKMVAKETEQRYQSCHELIDDLEGHPLLRQGGPAARITPPPRAQGQATVVTPAPAPRTATPSPAASLPGTGRANAVAAPAASAATRARVASPESKAKRQGSGLGMALGIAASVLLLLSLASAGTLYLLRDQIPAVQQVVDRFSSESGSQDQAAAAVTPPAPLVSAPDSPQAAVTEAPAMLAAAEAPARDTDADASAPSASGSPQPSLWRRVDESVAEAPGDSSEAQPAMADRMPGSAEPQRLADAPAASSDLLASAQATATPGSEATRSSVPVDGTQDRPEVLDNRPVSAVVDQRPADAQASPQATEAAAPMQVAQATPGARPAPATPRSAPPERPREQAVPRIPQVAVVALGDPALTGPAEHLIEERMLNEGYRIVEKTLIPGLSRLLADDNADVSEILEVIAGSTRVDALVLVRTQYVGQQELTYYGQSSTLYSVNLQVRAFSVAERRPLGGSFQERVDFTSLTADHMAKDAVEPNLGRLLEHLSPYRPQGRG